MNPLSVTCGIARCIVIENDTVEIVGGQHTLDQHDQVLQTVHDLLQHGHHDPVEIIVRPKQDTDSYVVNWRSITYNTATETWEPVTRDTETGLLDRVLDRCSQTFKQLSRQWFTRMPTFDVDATEIPVFEVNGIYVFKHYFEDADVFEQLEAYYNESAYRFELPTDDDLASVADVLADHFFELAVVEEIEPYCVAINKYEDHADILRNAVVTVTRGDIKIFLMKDELSAEQAIENGATRLTDTDLHAPF